MCEKKIIIAESVLELFLNSCPIKGDKHFISSITCLVFVMESYPKKFRYIYKTGISVNFQAHNNNNFQYKMLSFELFVKIHSKTAIMDESSTDSITNNLEYFVLLTLTYSPRVRILFSQWIASQSASNVEPYILH